MSEEILLFYDYYRDYVNETVQYFQNPDAQLKLSTRLGYDKLRADLGVDPRLLYKPREVPPGVLYLQKQLKLVNPRVITHPVANLALDMVDHAGHTVVPFVPFIKLPFWYEFGMMENSFTIGDTVNQYKAVLVVEDFFQPDLIRVEFITVDFQIKELIFDTKRQWLYEQIGTCENKDGCPLAATTVEGQLYYVAEQDAPGMSEFCSCAKAGFYWSQLVKIFNHILRQKAPIVQQDTDRSIAIPHQAARNKKERVENNRTEAHNKRRPTYITVSLSSPVRTQQAKPQGSGTQAKDYVSSEKIPVEGYWKWLIPGEGKPWNSFQIFYVESYKRIARASDERTRYIVEE